MTGQLLTAPEVAELIRMDVEYVWKLSRQNKIPRIRFGREYRYRETSILDWLESLESSPTPVMNGKRPGGA